MFENVLDLYVVYISEKDIFKGKRTKDTEGGVDVMCEVMQRYETIAKEEGRREGRVEGRLQLIASMLMSGKTAQEIAIFTGISPDEIEEAKQTILVNI